MKTKSQKGTSRRFSRGRFFSRRLSVLLPLIVLPLNLSPIVEPEVSAERIWGEFFIWPGKF